MDSLNDPLLFQLSLMMIIHEFPYQRASNSRYSWHCSVLAILLSLHLWLYVTHQRSSVSTHEHLYKHFARHMSDHVRYIAPTYFLFLYTNDLTLESVKHYMHYFSHLGTLYIRGGRWHVVRLGSKEQIAHTFRVIQQSRLSKGNSYNVFPKWTTPKTCSLSSTPVTGNT